VTGPDTLAALRRRFPAHRIERVAYRYRPARYEAVARFPGVHPHTVITADPAELAAALAAAHRAAAVRVVPAGWISGSSA
jgi:hypothetical protein